MRDVIRRATVVAGAAVVLLGTAMGVASAASGGPVLSWSPTTSPGTYNFGTVSPGSTVSQAFTLTDSGGGATSTLTVSLTGSSAFTKTKDTCTGTKLSPKKSCSVTVAYAPASSGQTDKATLTATSPKATASLTLLGQTLASPALSTSPDPASGPIGTVLQDTASLSGGSSPTGSIEFNLYATKDCSGTAVDTEKVPVSGDGPYSTSTGYKTAAAGTYQWTAAYSGDASNSPVNTACGDEPVTVSKASPAIATSPSPPSGAAGSQLTDVATLQGGFNATGTITFTVYTGTGCPAASVVFTQSVPVSGDGSYVSPPFIPTQAGTYYWVASYSGDDNNNANASGCNDEPVPVFPADFTLDPGQLTGTDPATGTNSYTFDFGPAGFATTTFTVTSNSPAPTPSDVLSVGGGTDGFTVAGDTCTGQVLVPGQSCTFDLTFTAPTGCPTGQTLITTLDIVGKTSGFPYIDLRAQAECP
jgi:hypothetical protein